MTGFHGVFSILCLTCQIDSQELSPELSASSSQLTSLEENLESESERKETKGGQKKGDSLVSIILRFLGCLYCLYLWFSHIFLCYVHSLGMIMAIDCFFCSLGLKQSRSENFRRLEAAEEQAEGIM